MESKLLNSSTPHPAPFLVQNSIAKKKICTKENDTFLPFCIRRWTGNWRRHAIARLGSHVVGQRHTRGGKIEDPRDARHMSHMSIKRVAGKIDGHKTRQGGSTEADRLTRWPRNKRRTHVENTWRGRSDENLAKIHVCVWACVQEAITWDRWTKYILRI